MSKLMELAQNGYFCAWFCFSLYELDVKGGVFFAWYGWNGMECGNIGMWD